jgi:DNA-binding CsgD family transcriptional regulator
MDQAPSVRAGLAVANALWEQGRHEEAARALEDARRHGDEATPSERAAIAAVGAWVEFWGLGRADAVLDELEVAAREAPPDRLPTVLGEAAAIEAARLRPGRALELAAPGSAAAATALGCFAVVTALSTAGRPDVALRHVTLPADDAGGPWEFAAMAYGFALIDAGHIAEASDLAFARVEAATRTGSRHGRCCWTIVLGRAEMMQGRTEGARHWFEQAARLALGAPGGIYLRRWALSGAMFCAVLLGDVAGAEAMQAALDAERTHGAVVHELHGRITPAWLAAERGDAARAASMLLAMADDAYAAGCYGPVVMMLMDATRLVGEAGPAARWLAGHAIDVDGRLFPAVIDWILALERGDADDLASIAERFVAADVPVLAAEAASASWTITRERGGDDRLAAARRRRAQELRAMFGAAVTPALADAPIELPLSRREHEIATLVARGATSREVAEELVIGVRTVESHLARVYDKLGIHARTELARALGLESVR